MAQFSDAIDTILLHEGGFVNDPLDPGGATNFGISLRGLQQHGVKLDLDLDGDMDADDIARLDREAAKELYRQLYWEPNHYSQIANQVLATKVFDLCVNAGAKQAHVVLQRALRACGIPVTEDGILGLETLAAVNKSDPGAVLAAFRSEMASFYRVLVVVKPTLSKFLSGWIRRAYA